PASGGLTCVMTTDGGRAAARGRAMFESTAVPARIDASTVKQAAAYHATRAELDALDRGVVKLGPSFAGFDELWLAGDTAVSWINPSIVDSGFVLPPRLMDAAIQTGAVLLAGDDGPSLRLRYPASVAAIDIVGSVSADGSLVLARRTGP